MSEIQSNPIQQTAYDTQSSLNQVQKTPPAEKRSKVAPSSQQVENQAAASNLAPKRQIPQSTTKTKLKFQVDRDSNDVTVLILDAKSHEVIRTVPPEELAELTPGELIDLSR